VPQESGGVDESFGGDYVELLPAGASGKGEFCCTACGYGAILMATLPPCPMCGERLWERVAWRPFRRVSEPA
jgi:rubrerythrin